MTFSIVARDPQSGALGVATATAGPAVGALVPHARSAVGAVATQAMTQPLHGPRGLALLARGLDAATTLARLIASDPEPQRRQLLVIDRHGATAGWQGDACASHCGERHADGVGVAGNLLAGPAVLDALLDGYLSSAGRALEERLLEALKAGADAGGDRRGLGSAALKLCDGRDYPTFDLRIDWSDTPLADLARLLAAVRTPEYLGFLAAIPRH